jgi:phage tail-like protein
MPTTQGKRDYATGSSSLELSGAFAGQLVSVEGGDAAADVIEEKLGSDSVVHKHVAGVRYTDIELECGAGMERTFFDWIQDTLTHKFTRKSGTISFLDSNYQEHSRLEFSHALLTRVSFPALDAASKDAVTMTVKLSPEYTQRHKGNGQGRSAPVGSKGQGAWTPASFRLQIDGLDCTQVNKVEPLIVTTAVAESMVGELRDYQKEPAHLEVPDLVLTLSESQAATFYAWHEDFVIKGMNGPEYEKNGTLEFLSPNQTDVLFTLQFKNLGIFKLASVRAPLASETIAHVRASMYCEEITLGAKSIAPPAASPSPPGPVPAPAAPTGEEPTGVIVAGEFPHEFTRLRAAVDGQTDPRELFTDDGIGTSPTTATSLGTIFSGTRISRTGARGPSKPAWFVVTMPCNDSCAARVQMTNGPAFDVFGPSFQTLLARGVTIYDVSLSPALTQLYVNVPAGPWASYTLIISRD